MRCERMSEFSDFILDRNSESGAMSGCYKLYSWINHTVLMLLLQILWKVSQISDYFKEKPLTGAQSETSITLLPLTMELKQRRHIRSMSDVQNSTPYRLPFRSRKGSSATLSYDSDTRARRIQMYNHQRYMDSSDSSDGNQTRKMRSLEQHILKHTDSMRVL